MKRSSLNGFTLIELMITVVILSILAAIAYPTYTNYVTEARRSDATINLTRIAAQEEKFFTECGRYIDTFGGLISDPVGANRCSGLAVPGVSGNPNRYTTLDGYYTLEVALVAGPLPAAIAGGGGYTLTARPVGVQNTRDGTKCATISISNTGAKSATGSDSLTGPNGGKCWKK